MVSEEKVVSQVLWEDLAALLLLPVLIYLSTYVWLHPLVRMVSGFAFILVAPGYSLLAAVFPKSRALDLTTRFGLSMGVSIALATIIGLALNYTVFGISGMSALITATAFVVVCTGVALWRRKVVSDETERDLTSGGFLLLRKLPWVIGIYIVFMSIFSIGGFSTGPAKTTSVSDAEERFTEFYVVALDTHEDDRRGTYFTGEPILFTLIVVNREGVDGSYRVVVSGDDVVDQTFDFRLESGEQWTQVVVVVHTHGHQNAKESFFLYKQGIAEPYRSLYIWTTIVPPE